MAWTTPVLVSRPAGVRVLLWDRWACEDEREPEAKEVHRHPGDGHPCPRCGGPMQVREYEEQLPQPSSYTRWFCCMNKTCKTTLVMPARYKVIR
jgi:hypothetical protein